MSPRHCVERKSELEKRNQQREITCPGVRIRGTSGRSEHLLSKFSNSIFRFHNKSKTNRSQTARRNCVAGKKKKTLTGCFANYFFLHCEYNLKTPKSRPSVFAPVANPVRRSPWRPSSTWEPNLQSGSYFTSE